jgi:DNA-binding transcriptional LysR family regulator
VSLSRHAPDHHFNKIELRHLNYFVVLAEELHFGHAAVRLHMTQPGLSQAIARLERLLDVQLFTRTHSTVALTKAGMELLHRARRILTDIEETVSRVRMVARDDTSVVRVGVALLTEPIVAPALRDFQIEHGGIVLDRSSMLSERLLTQLSNGNLDLALVHQVPVAEALDRIVWEPLRESRLAVLVGPRNELASRKSVTLSELKDQTFLVNPRLLAPGAFDGLKHMCRVYGGFDATVLESAAASTVALDRDWRPILTGRAVLVMPGATADAVHPPDVVPVRIQAPPRHILALAWRRGERVGATQRVVDYLRMYRDQRGWVR